MKKILITGANSYIGTSFERWVSKWPDKYKIDSISVRGSDWKNESFGEYDVVFHVAGIAHSDYGKISAEKEKLYRNINTDLTVQTAIKAKTDGVKQFIFMSSIIVYGDSAPIGKEKFITRDTKPSPTNCYGDSKLQAEIGIQALEDDHFNVVILRPPMIYGKGSKGNYPSLAKIAKKVPIFPKVQNSRSMLYIENLCQFVKLMIDNCESGVFWPQNSQFSNTSEVVKMIAKVHGKRIWLTSSFNWCLYILRVFTGLVDKAFGNMTYDMKISDYKVEYRIKSIEESIKSTEG